MLRGHDKSLFDLAFSPDGSTLATASFDGNTKLWDLRAELDEVKVRAAVA